MAYIYEYRIVLKSNNEQIIFQTDHDVLDSIEAAWQQARNLTINIDNKTHLMIRMSEVAAIKASMI